MKNHPFPWTFGGFPHWFRVFFDKKWVKKNLVEGGFNPFEKYWSNWIISPCRGENKTCLKPPPRNGVKPTRSFTHPRALHALDGNSLLQSFVFGFYEAPIPSQLLNFQLPPPPPKKKNIYIYISPSIAIHKPSPPPKRKHMPDPNKHRATAWRSNDPCVLPWRSPSRIKNHWNLQQVRVFSVTPSKRESGGKPHIILSLTKKHNYCFCLLLNYIYTYTKYRILYLILILYYDFGWNWLMYVNGTFCLSQ